MQCFCHLHALGRASFQMCAAFVANPKYAKRTNARLRTFRQTSPAISSNVLSWMWLAGSTAMRAADYQPHHFQTMPRGLISSRLAAPLLLASPLAECFTKVVIFLLLCSPRCMCSQCFLYLVATHCSSESRDPGARVTRRERVKRWRLELSNRRETKTDCG